MLVMFWMAPKMLKFRNLPLTLAPTWSTWGVLLSSLSISGLLGTHWALPL